MKRAVVVVLLTAVSLLLGCGGKSPEEIAEEKQVQEQKPIELSASDLTTAYQESAEKADEKYKGKVVQVSGAIERFTGSDSASIVVLKGSLGSYKETSYRWGVYCSFSLSDQQSVALLAKGSQVTIKGICPGWDKSGPSVDVKRCKLVQ